MVLQKILFEIAFPYFVCKNSFPNIFLHQIKENLNVFKEKACLSLLNTILSALIRYYWYNSAGCVLIQNYF